MARWRRNKGFGISDVPLVFSSMAFAVVFALSGLVEVSTYYLFEPAPGDSSLPMSTMPHMFWEATAVRFFWPGVAVLLSGLSGITFCAARAAMARRK